MDNKTGVIKTGQYAGEDFYTVSVRVPKSIYQPLVRLANENDRPTALQVLNIVKLHLTNIAQRPLIDL